MRIYYYYPTFDKPSGGNKQLRIQAMLLRDLGLETYLLRDELFFSRPDSFDDDHFYNVPVPTAPFPFEHAPEHLTPHDVILLPEVVLDRSLAACSGWDVRLAINNQNGFYGLRYGPPSRLIRNRIEFVFANAPYVAALCRRFYGLPPQRIFHVPHWIVRPPFDLRETHQSRRFAVCYMPRKMPELVKAIREAVQRLRPDVPWVEIDGVPESVVAERLRENKIFFAAQDLEGCPLTALEAMACGALVAGFPGTMKFSHPYATATNGCWAKDRDCEGAVSGVVRAIDLARAGGAEFARVIEAGAETAMRFSKDAVSKALAEVVRVVSARAYEGRRVPDWKLSRAEAAYAYKLLYDYDRLGWPGRLLGWAAKLMKPVRATVFRQSV